ncbi:hypothetical protein [Vibrio sp. SCSIO 43136]|uniref:hypothetical protein n=1 Tax=Vibrio sp. SCSIO 43136 TaxID=2819101 RepID=UPI002074F2FA|nr:hypothetical protein [Vibrio sp. SCSIO 43136]USD66332.1 hypothetical protein J4N39_05815 [Vibrio sp. SCSIO 43136]
MTKLLDSRTQGLAAEHILVSLLCQNKGIHAVSFDTVGFDVIAWDTHDILFSSQDPCYIQVKLRMSSTENFTTQGHDRSTIAKLYTVADALGVSTSQCYFCVCFAKMSDVRTTEYFIIPLSKLELFDKGGAQYRFSYSKCLELAESESIVHL